MEINRLKKLAGFIAENASQEERTDPRYLFASTEPGTDRGATTRRMQKLGGIINEDRFDDVAFAPPGDTQDADMKDPEMGYDDDEPLTGKEGADDFQEPDQESEVVAELRAQVEKLTKQLEIAKDMIKRSHPSFR